MRAVHVAGGAAGGALVGALAGGLGALAHAGAYAPALLVGVGAALLVLRIRSGDRAWGLDRQVPRSWGSWMGPIPLFWLWGMLLGSGVATVVPYLCFFVLIAAEATVPILVAALAGAIYGGVRQTVAIALAAWGDRERIMGAYERLRPAAERLDLTGLAAGTAALAALALVSTV